jgi:sugar phosphate permease
MHLLKNKSILLILVAILSSELFYFYISMLKSSVSTLSVLMIRDYDLTAPNLSVIVSAFYITALILKIPAGVIVDRYGPKYPLVIAIILTAIGTFLFSQSSSLLLFSLSRAIIAIGYSCSLLATVKILAKYLPARLYALLIGSTLFCGYLGASFSGYPLATIINIYPWSQVFVWISIIGITLAIIIFISLDSSNDVNESTDHTLLKTITQSLGLLKQPQIVILAIFTGVIVSGAIGIADLWGRLYLYKFSDIDKDSAAFVSTTMVYLGISVGSLIWGTIQSAIQGGRMTLFLITLINALLIIAFFFFGIRSITMLSIIGFLIGATSASKVICYDIARSLVDYKNLAVIVGILAMSVTGMAAVIQLIAGTVLKISQQIFTQPETNYTVTILSLPCILILAAILSLFIKPKIDSK